MELDESEVMPMQMGKHVAADRSTGWFCHESPVDYRSFALRTSTECQEENTETSFSLVCIHIRSLL